MRAILTYHSIDDSGSPISTPPSAFAEHVAWLRSGRVRVTSIHELMALPPGTDAVAVTFDDGFCNFEEQAAPLLQGLPVTLFVVTDHAGGTNQWGGRPQPGIPTLPLLDWPALGRLHEAGVTLGAHSRTHPDLARLSPSALVDELSGCAERLRSRTGAACDVFAYPYGSRSPAVESAVSSRFAWACTTELRGLHADERRTALPRIDMYYFQQPGRLKAWAGARFRTYLAARRLLRSSRAAASAWLGSPVPGGPR